MVGCCSTAIMFSSLIFSILLIVLNHPLTEALLASPLTHVQPSFKILNEWKAQQEWENTHDMELVEKYMINARQYLISSMSMHEMDNKSSCLTSLILLGYDTYKGDRYALQALDAAGKPQSGILRGNMKWNGRYYECLKAKSKSFNGKWCGLSIGQSTSAAFIGTSVGMSIGMCLPDSCSEDSINEHLQILESITNSSITVHCPIQPTEWTWTDIFSMVVFSLLLASLLLGTAVDYYIGYKNDKENEALSISANEIPIDATRYKSEARSVWTETVVCFSAIKNTNLILDTSRKSGTIDCLHGIRFLSISWVVLGHTYLMTTLYSANILDVTDWFFNAFSFQVIANGFFGVDTFFFLSGLLVTYLSLKESTNFQGKHVPMMYLQRYLRLTPTYAFIILFVVGFYGKLGNGPMWPDAYNAGKTVCNQYWWTNMLYINNLYPTDLTGECISVGWYLANDMQFFLLAPISILLLKWRPKIGVNVLLFGVFSSVLVTGIISAHFKEQPQTVRMAILLKIISNGGTYPPPQPQPPHNGSLQANNLGMPPMSPTEAFWSDLYAKPWCRIGVYIIGMMTGYLLHATKMKIKMTKLFAALSWAMATALNISLLYGLWWYCKQGVPMTVSLAAFYNAVCRPLWGVGLGWLVVACACGYGGPVNTFLSWKLFTPLSRLTFCIYLTHPQILVWWHATQAVTTYYSNTQYAFFFLGVLVCSIGVAYFLSILVEMPFVNLTKLLLNRRKTENAVQNTEQLLVNEEMPTA